MFAVVVEDCYFALSQNSRFLVEDNMICKFSDWGCALACLSAPSSSRPGFAFLSLLEVSRAMMIDDVTGGCIRFSPCILFPSLLRCISVTCTKSREDLSYV